MKDIKSFGGRYSQRRSAGGAKAGQTHARDSSDLHETKTLDHLLDGGRLLLGFDDIIGGVEGH